MATDIPVENSPTVEVLRQRIQVLDLKDGDEEATPVPLPMDTQHAEFPDNSRFFETFEHLVHIEFQFRDVSVQDALYEMWGAHVYQFGGCCDEGCDCFYALGELASSVYYANARSMNFLSCFLPKFVPLLKKEYPRESREQLCCRLECMWNRHCSVAIQPTIQEMELPCTFKTCRCSDFWDFLFNRGECSPSYGVSIQEEMDSIREFRTKYTNLVSAEYTITEFPDACNFALGRMWQRHVQSIGEQCGATCTCWRNVSDFGATVIHEMLMKREASNWDNPMRFEANSVPTGALLCYGKSNELGAAITARAQIQDNCALDKFLCSWPAANGSKCGPDCCCRV